ncbi:MAG: 50S ribosomal protein L10 [Actinomycetota bacterium]|nr:50S ribosomal protein L10 [Actinomycetota bacterium]
MARDDTSARPGRAGKVALAEEVRQRLAESTAVVLTEYRGLTVGELARLRAQLRETEAEYKIVKNTLTRIAAREAGLDIPEEVLTGPTAVTFCAGDPVAVAKVLRAFSREHPDLVVKGGVMEGRTLDAAETRQLADLPSREQLLATVAATLQSLLAQPARLAQASLSKVARLATALAEQKGGPQPPEPTAGDESTTRP